MILKKSFLWSLLGHIVIITLMVLDLSFAFDKHVPNTPAIMMVDLTKVKIADKTNLPQKTVAQKKKAPVKPTPKAEEKKIAPPKSTQKPAQKSEPKPVLKPKETPVKEAVPVKTKETKQEIPKSKPIQKQKTNSNYNLQELLTSVEKVRKTPMRKELPQEDLLPETDGIQGGTEGRIDQVLTISERDFLASELQKCWNIDAGVERADEIIVEIKAWINKDGTVRDVKIMNSMTIPSFRTVAESARRALYICDNKGADSPFRILANKYADHYGDWKEISLRFNPLQGIH